MADNYALSYHEILMKVNNKKDKPGKLEVLRRYDTEQLRMFLKGSFDPKCEWLLPEGAPPYKPQPKESDTQGVLISSVRKFGVFLQNNGYDNLRRAKREQIFIEYLEAMDPDDAKLLLQIKERKMPFKTLTKSIFSEAYPQLAEHWEVKK